jgi:rod shape-determining protein MreD
MSERLFPRGAVVASVIGALLLMLVPLPDMVAPLRPNWLALVVAYWALETPSRARLGFAFTCGLVADVALGSLLGEHALRLVVLVWLLQRSRARLRFSPLTQQALTIGALLFLDHALHGLVAWLSGQPLPRWSGWLSPVVGMLLWPPLFVLLDAMRLSRRR